MKTTFFKLLSFLFFINLFFLTGCQLKPLDGPTSYPTQVITPSATSTSDFISTLLPQPTPIVFEEMVKVDEGAGSLPKFIQFTGINLSSESLYAVFKSGDKSSVDFMSLDGLSRGTFFFDTRERKLSSYHITSNNNILFVFVDQGKRNDPNTYYDVIETNLEGEIIKSWRLSIDSFECTYHLSNNGSWLKYLCTDKKDRLSESVYVTLFNFETGDKKTFDFFCPTNSSSLTYQSRVSNEGELLFYCYSINVFYASDLSSGRYTKTQGVLLENASMTFGDFSPSGDKVVLFSQTSEGEKYKTVVIKKTECVISEKECSWSKHFDLLKYQPESFLLGPDNFNYIWSSDETELAWLIAPRTTKGVPAGHAGTYPAPSSAGILNLENNSNKTIYSWLISGTHLRSWSPDKKWWLMSDEHGLFFLSLEDGFVRRIGEKMHFLGWVIKS